MEKNGTDAPGTFQVSDKRFWIEDPDAVDKATAGEPKYPSFVEELKSRTEAAESKLRERLQHLEEENDAFRCRLKNQVDSRVTKEKAVLIASLLDIIDALERAVEAAREDTGIEALREGVQFSVELFHNRLRAGGVEVIDNLNQPFDPTEAEAISVVEVENPDMENTVTAVVQKGYRLGDQILRAARVMVGQYR